MSDILKNSLKDRLLKLQCHFTWDLLPEHVDIKDVEERIIYQLEFLPDAPVHRMHNILAYLRHLRGDNDGAMLQLQKAEAQIQESSTSQDTDVRSTVMYGNFAWVCFHLNQFIKGYTYVKKVEDILKKHESPPMQKTLLLDIYSEQGWTYLSYTGQYYERSAECFKKALELDPEDPELNSGYATALYRMEGFTYLSKPTHESIPHLERAVELNPKDTVMKTQLALKYIDVKKYDQGAKLIEQALQEQPESPYVLRYVASFYKRTRQIGKAIPLIRKALAFTPTSCVLHIQLARCYKQIIQIPRASYGQSTQYFMQKKTDAIANAIFHSEEAVELNESSVAAHILLAEIYVAASKYQEAEKVFEKTLSLNNITSAEKQELHLIWANYFLYCRKLTSEAARHYKEVLLMQSQTYYREKAKKQLKRLAETMIAKNYMDATGYALLGFIHQQTGQSQAAIEYYEKALQLQPDNQECLDALFALQATLS